MRMRLRWKIMVATVIPVLGLTTAVLWTVDRSVSRQAKQNIREDLIRAAAIFEDMLASSAEELGVASQVIVEDPKFFSVLTIPLFGSDPQARATAEGVARDFNAITQVDLFLVFDAAGHLLADAGRVSASRRNWGPLLKSALAGHPKYVILVDSHRHFQATITPVRAGQRLVGAVLLGTAIGQTLAERLRPLTRSEVTFLSSGHVTGSTLDRSEDRERLSNLLTPCASSPLPGEGQVFEFAGTRATYITIARQLPGSAASEGQFYAMQRSLETETAFLGPIRAVLTEIGLVALVLSITVGYFISRGISAPVRTLVRGAEEMERGNYDYPIDVRTRDEIGYLALRFRDMRQQQRVYVKSLEEVSRIKGEFINVASHELRTPISILKGFLELLADGQLGPLTANQHQAVEAMDRGVKTLVRIAENASRLAQIQSKRFVLALGEHDVPEFLLEAARRAEAAGVGRTVAVWVDVESEIGSALVDRPRLVEAIYHLVCNGIRFTPDGGSVTVQANRDGAKLVIQVRDTGVGIPAERMGKLLDRSLNVQDSLNHHSSSTLEFNSAGLGLGIPIARSVVEAHGGTLALQSEPGVGSVFTMHVPLRPAPALEEAA